MRKFGGTYFDFCGNKLLVKIIFRQLLIICIINELNLGKVLETRRSIRVKSSGNLFDSNPISQRIEL